MSIHARIGWQGLKQDEHLDIGDYYLITGTDFENGFLNYTKMKYISKFRYDQDKNIQIQNNDILITKDGSIGKVVLVKNISKPATLNAGVYRVRVLTNSENIIDSVYLYHYLSAPFLLNFANKQSSGGTIKHLNQSQIVNFKIPCPSLKEQNKIADFISLINKKISIINKKINILKKYKEGLKKFAIKDTINFWKTNIGKASRLSNYLHEVNDHAKNNGSFQHVTLSIDGISSKSERYDRDFLVKDENKKYKITHLNQLCFNPANLKFGVICINHYGDGIFSPIYVTYDIENINKEYLELILTSLDFRNYSLKYQQGTVYERMSVSSDDLCNIEIVVAEKSMQEDIAEIASLLNKKISKLEKELNSIIILKSNLLNKMFI